MPATAAIGTPSTAALRRLPEITLWFWVMKICATTLGETGGDHLSMTLNLGYAESALVLLGVFALTLLAQLMSRRLHPLLYWSVILSTSTAGTVISDYMDRTLALGYAAGSGILAGLLGLCLLVWWLRFRSLSVSAVQSRPQETLYWITILVSNTLGTALGDFLADDSGLGFAGGAAVISAALALLSLAYATTTISRVALFWCAFVLTRPFGATAGDLLTKPVSHGGLGLGTSGSSLVLLLILLACILWVSRRAPQAAHAA